MAAAYQGPRGDTNGSETPLLEPLLPRGGDVGDASVLGDREGSDHYQQGSHRCDEPRKNSALGLGLMLLSALFFSTMTMLVKARRSSPLVPP